MGHIQLTSDNLKPVAPDPGGNRRPVIARNAWALDDGCVASNSRASSGVKHSLRMQEGNQRLSDNIYLAQPISVASAHSSLAQLRKESSFRSRRTFPAVIQLSRTNPFPLKC